MTVSPWARLDRDAEDVAEHPPGLHVHHALNIEATAAEALLISRPVHTWFISNHEHSLVMTSWLQVRVESRFRHEACESNVAR